MKRFIITAGGTGGHIFPALAIAEELIARNCDILYVGNKDSMEEQIVRDLNIPYAAIDVQKLHRFLTIKHFLFPFKLIKSIAMSKAILDKYQPDGCIGAGGFVSGPLLFRAALSKIPIYLQEQNSVPGLTTKILSRFATKIFSGFDQASNTLPAKNFIYSGNPVRKDILKARMEDDSAKRTNILIIGGSQGAKAINDSVLVSLPTLYADLDSKEKPLNIFWQCGDRNFEHLKSKLDTLPWQPSSKPKIRYTFQKEDRGVSSSLSTLTLFPFTNDIASIYDKTDIAIARAGAISLTELEIKKIPAIIIPIPKSAGNHQYHNAAAQQEAGRGILLEQHKLNPTSLQNAIRKVVDNLKQYKQNFYDSRHSQAASLIADVLLGIHSNNHKSNLNITKG